MESQIEHGAASVLTTPAASHLHDAAHPHTIPLRSQVAVVILTRNALRHWAPLSTGIRLQGLPPAQVIVVDSNSTDETRELAAAEGYQVVPAEARQLNPAALRRLALEFVPWAAVVVYLAQDAILATSGSLDRLVAAFEDPGVAAAFGRQLPRLGARPIEAHASLYHFPGQSSLAGLEGGGAPGVQPRLPYGSFSAYRVDALLKAGGFPSNVITGEDAIVAARLLLAGWKTAYAADALVHHSHRYSLAQELGRSFDEAVCLEREPWLARLFPTPAGEHKRFLRSEISYLSARSPQLFIASLLRALARTIGAQLGSRQTKPGRGFPAIFSYNKDFWSGSKAPR